MPPPDPKAPHPFAQRSNSLPSKAAHPFAQGPVGAPTSGGQSPGRPTPQRANTYAPEAFPLDQKAEEEQFLRVHRFIDEVVAPWATQARISQIISNDYDSAEQALGSAFERAGNFYFPPTHQQAQIGGEHRYLLPVFKPLLKEGQGSSGAKFSLIHHGYTDQETIGSVQAVRLYTVVWSEVPANDKRYKDVHQHPSGDISILSGDAETRENLFWISAQPLRALKWFEKYKADTIDKDRNPKFPKPVIRSYCVGLAEYEEIAGDAHPERVDKAAGDTPTINVDVHAASDQFGLGKSGLGKLRVGLIKGTLKSYVDDFAHASPERSGERFHVSVLRKNLGVPDEDIRHGDKGSVFLKKNGDFQSKKKFSDLADDLMSIYGIWYEKPDMISARWARGATGTRRLPKVFEILKMYGFDVPHGARSIAQRVTNSPTPPRPGDTAIPAAGAYGAALLNTRNKPGR